MLLQPSGAAATDKVAGKRYQKAAAAIGIVVLAALGATLGCSVLMMLFLLLRTAS